MEGGEQEEKEAKLGHLLFFFPTPQFHRTRLPQNERYGEKTDLSKRDREAGGKLEKLSTARRRELVSVSEMRAFLYKMMDLHNTLLTWLRN